MSEPDAPPSGATAATVTNGQPAADRLFAGRYRLTGRRGSGLDIALFEAVDVLGDRTVAVKIIHPDICARPGFDEQFTQVVHLVAGLRHPNIAQILDIGAASWNGQPVRYVVCENLTGGSMRDLRDRGRQLSPSQVVMVGLDVCRGLDAAHRAGLVHGDIRPANLVFGDDGKLRITDLGLAELVSEEIWSNPAAVSADRARYASPEQATGVPAGPKSDVYSLCLCLLEAVTGQLPFVGDSTVATLSNRLDKLMPVSADQGPLAAVFERSGRPDPLDRFTAAEFGRALVQAAERLPRPAPIALLSTGLFAESASATAAPLPSTATDPALPLAPILPVADAADISPRSVVAPSNGSGSQSRPTVVQTVITPSTGPVLIVPHDRAVAADGGVHAQSTAPGADGAGVAAAPTSSVPQTLPTGVVGPAVSAADQPIAAIPPPPQPDPPLLRHSTARRKLLAVVAIIVVAAALGGALAWFLGRDQSNPVPDLVGLQKGAALNMVSGFDWNVTTIDESSDAIPAGSVLRTDPAAGVTLNQRANFLIVISSGPQPRALPELAGLTLEQATAALTELELVLESGDTISDPTVPSGSIISWSVPAQTGLTAGDTVVRGTKVRVVVSSGPAPVVVPELSGLALADATAQIEAVGLVVAQAPDEFSDTVPIGSVIRQDPPAGSELPIAAPVTVVVSKGTQFVVIPPLADLTLQQANDALIAAGLVLGRVNGDPAGVNILAEVNGASVVANATFERGTPIDLTFGTPPTTTTAPPETTVAPTTMPA